MSDVVRAPRPQVAALVPWDATVHDADVRLDSNENPHDMPERVLQMIREEAAAYTFHRYPDPLASSLRRQIAELHGVGAENVLVGNGSDELILNAILAWGGHARTLLVFPPTFSIYAFDALISGAEVAAVPRASDFSLELDAIGARLARGDVSVVAFANPNNPTGTLVPPSDLVHLLEMTDALVIVDEAYYDFCGVTMNDALARHRNLVITRSLSKAYSLAGLRLGYAVAHADVIRTVATVRQPYSVDRFGQIVGSIALRERLAFAPAIHAILAERERLRASLSMMPGVTVFASCTNFLLFRVTGADAVWRELLQRHSVLIRQFPRASALEDCLRVTVGSPAENTRFIEAMAAILSSRVHRPARHQSQPDVRSS